MGRRQILPVPGRTGSAWGGGLSAPDRLCQNHILSLLPQLPKGETHVFADHTVEAHRAAPSPCIQSPFMSHVSQTTLASLFSTKDNKMCDHLFLVGNLARTLIRITIHYLSFSLPNSSSGSETMVKNMVDQHYPLHHHHIRLWLSTISDTRSNLLLCIVHWHFTHFQDLMPCYTFSRVGQV